MCLGETLRKSASFYKLGHPDKVCYLSGIPEAYLKKDYTITFQKISYTDPYTKKAIVLSSSKQDEVFKKLLDPKVISSNMLIGISSTPTEEGTMQAAVKIMKYAIGSPELKFNMLNLALLENIESKQDYLESNPLDLLFITGLTPESTQSRVQLCRDFVKMYEGACRIVLIAGEDPLTFFYEKLRMKPNLVFMANGGTSKSISL